MTHSYSLTGIEEHDWLWIITHGQVFFSWFGIRGIFVISGFLIFQSLTRCNDLYDFYWKRILRLFPAFAVVLFITVLLGPFVYESSTPYLKNKSVWTYIGNNLSLYNMQFDIAGIFDNNRYKSIINGSVWTRPFEFTMYIAVSLLFFFRRRKLTVIMFLGGLYLILAVLTIFYRSELQQMHFVLLNWYIIELGVYFVAGALFAACGVENIPMVYINISFWVSVLVSILTTQLLVFGYLIVLLIPLLTITFCLRPFTGISNIQDKIGDLSYGIHLYGFPVQQTLVYFFELDYLGLMVSSLAISAFFAYFSYHLIERRIVKFKKVRPAQSLRQLWKTTNHLLRNRSVNLD